MGHRCEIVTLQLHSLHFLEQQWTLGLGTTYHANDRRGRTETKTARHRLVVSEHPLVSPPRKTVEGKSKRTKGDIRGSTEGGNRYTC